MQLLHLAIPDFRNLRGLVMDFATHFSHAESVTIDAPPRPIRSHALIGQNGTGKSNLIEALITIFRDIDLDRDAAFDYTLAYTIRSRSVRIHSDTARQKRPFVWVDDQPASQGYLLQNRELLPSHIFAYYSGRNERIETLFQEHQRRFNRRQEITTEETLSEEALAALYKQGEFDAVAAARLRSGIENRSQRAGDDRLRRLFYCRGGHSQLVLLACLLSDDTVFQKVLGNLNIESLESALFVLKEPHRLHEKRRSGRFDEQDLAEGDPRFWYARGNVVSEFLDKLWQVAWAPIEQEATKQIDFRGRTEKQKQLYLFVPSQEKLRQLGDLVGGTDSFFRYAEGAYIGDLIEEVRITVKKRDDHGGAVSFTQLSEGELQMLTVLGLMRINRKKGGWFPLRTGSVCSTYALKCEESEARYLLDPTDIEDVKLIAFDEEGKVTPSPYTNDWEKDRVDETVKRLKLNDHVPLAEERRKIWAKTSDLIARYQKAIERKGAGTNLVAEQKAREAARQIHEMTRPDHELSSVARWCVLFRNEPLLNRLVA